MSTLKLYDAAAALATVNEWIDEHWEEVLANGGALTPELEQLLAQAEGDFRTKVERVALVIRQKKATAAVIKVEEDRLAQRRRVEENAAKSLTEYLKRQLEAAGETSVKGTLATVRVQANPASVRHALSNGDLLLFSETPLPLSHCITVERVGKLDARALLEAMRLRGEMHALDAEHTVSDAMAAAAGVSPAEWCAEYVRRRLAEDFPGVTIERGSHVRIS